MKKIFIFWMLILAVAQGAKSQTYALPALQTINYKYHIRGGMLGINLDATNNPIPNKSEGDLFSYKLEYEGASGYYNGNISQQIWNRPNINGSCNTNLRSYSFTYDNASRLTAATYAGVEGENYSLPEISYDKNGNIMTLKRNGASAAGYGAIDNLTYTYTGNQLTKVADAVAGNHTVDLVPNGTGERTFYKTGRLKSDANKQIDLIIYDLFTKLPTEIQLTSGRTIKMVYLADGTLLKRVYSTNGVVSDTWVYSNGMVHKNGQPYSMAIPEGRAVYEGDNWKNEFFITDHLGNTRVTFEGVNGYLTSKDYFDVDPWGVELLGINQSSATNTVNNFKFLDREKVSWVGFYDLKKRNFDPTIGVFTSVDELSDQEEQESLSPYQYGWNNPVLRSDPNGLYPGCCGDFFKGLNNAIREDVFPLQPSANRSFESNSYSAGKITGHIASMAFGALEIATGGTGNAGSAVATVGSAGLASPVSIPVAIASTALIVHGASVIGNAISNLNSEGGNYNRVSPRKGTREKVKEAQPKNSKGQMLDPNTFEPIDPKKTDLGHKPGNEWHKRKEMHKQKGSSRKEVLEAENNPDLYQYEDRSNNRSRKYEKRD